MNNRIPLLLALASLTSSIANASMTNVVEWGDYTNVNCYTYTFTAADGVLTMQADQYATGNMWGKVQTDTPTDPSLTLANTINNDTGFAWTGYDIKVLMNQSFTVSSPTVIGPIYGPGNWGVQSYTPTATYNGSQWVADILLGGTTPIPQNTGLLSFSYTISFTGSANFSEILTPIPEPGALSLVLGGLVCGMLRRRQIAR